VFEYAAKVLRQPGFDPNTLLLRSHSPFDGAKDSNSIVDAVALPTPRGFVRVSGVDADELWGTTRVEDIVDAKRLRGLSSGDLALRRLLFVAAVRLHSLGLLAPDNRPTLDALELTLAACPCTPQAPGLRLRDRFVYDSVDRRGASGSYSSDR
jgi:hypothetical protein